MAKELTSIEELHELLQSRLADEKIKTYDDFKNLILNCSDKNLEKAVDITYKSILNKERIILIHDSDMDGLGTATLSYRFFSKFISYPVKIEITNRKEGYGFLPIHLDRFPGDLYITADNGITSFDACKYAKKLNKKVIITDHHQPEKIDNEIKLPEADAIVDTMHPDCSFEFKEISGSVVYFIFLWKLLEKFNYLDKLDEWYQETIDILALTTLSDVMPLDISINRFFIRDFLDNFFENFHHEYIKTFKRLHNESPTAEDFSFSLIPAMNATQRMSSPVYGFYYLIHSDPKESEKYFNYLLDLNNKRKAIQQELLEYIEKYYKDWIKDKNFIVIPGKFKKEYEGILGIVAGRLAERYQRPCIVLNLKDDNSYSGSGRSFGDIDILKIFRDLREINSDWFSHIGGHKQALGLGIKKEYLNDFWIELQKYMDKNFKPDDFVVKKYADFYISLSNLQVMDTDLYYEIIKWEPFGNRFPKPKFKTQAYIKSIRKIGKQKNHLTLEVSDKNNLITIKGLWFFFDEKIINELDQKLNQNQLVKVNLFWFPDIDSWGGNEKLALRIFAIEIL